MRLVESVASRVQAAQLGLVYLFALWLRVNNLSSLPIFTDEAIYLRWAADIWDQRTFVSLFIPIMDDGKQPLHIWLAMLAMRLFEDPLIGGRMVSVVAGVASCFGVGMAGRWLAGSSAGLIAALLYAVVPFTLVFDRMALADSLLNAASIWAFALSIFVASRASDRRWAVVAGLGAGLALGAALWTKLTALFIVPVPALCLLLVGRPARRSDAAIGVAAGYGVLGFMAFLLTQVPDAENQLKLVQTHAFSPTDLGSRPIGSLPVNTWVTRAGEYWSWIELYLPAPLHWIALAGIPWGLWRRTRPTLLLAGTWAVVVIPSVVFASLAFTTRYVVHSVFPLLILAAILLAWTTEWILTWLGQQRLVACRPAAAILLSGSLVAAVVARSILFDLDFTRDPRSVTLAATDRGQYVEGWPSGYGFAEALELVVTRAGALGGTVFVISDHFQGLPRDGLSLYLRGLPGVRHYVDGHIPWGGKGLVEAWSPHQVPLIVVRNDGRYKQDEFEKLVPEAKLLGVFWKPTGRDSFRVYEIEPRQPAG